MSDSPPSSQRRSVARGLLFRAGAVLLGLAPFFLAEGACLLFDWGRPSLHDDPFVGFSAVRPLFVLSEDGRRYEIPRGRQKFFRPESFAAEKGADEFRIFCLGGSTVQGRPLAIETSFTTWLEIALAEADPRRRWEVVNCGGVSYASYRLAPILEEVLLYKPDLIVLYTGHNEFLEDRTYRSLKEQSAAMRGVLEQVSRLRTFTLLREVGLRLVGDASGETPGRPILKTEVEALLDYRGGLEMYHRDDAWRRDVVQHFRYNLRRMVAMAHDAGAPVVLVNPVCNLRDSPPFKAQHRDGLTPEERRRWSELWSSAEQHYASDMQKAAALLRRAVEIDPLHAGAHYQLGKCYDALGQDVQAGEAYLRAKELDVCPLRILESMNHAVLETAEATGAPLVDAMREFRRRSERGLVGDKWLVDHIHPNIRGHQLLANLLAQELARQGVIRPAADWEERRAERYQEHRDSLNELYFLKGKQRLENLRLWAQGGVSRVRPAPGRPTKEGGSGVAPKE